MSCVGLEPMPERIEPNLCERIRREMFARDITMAAVTGTFNMAHPDPAHRRDGLARLQTLASACNRLDTAIITLCTGTRDPDNMWRRHPDNDSRPAWADLLQTMEAALQIAEDAGITLAFEPEVSNVVDSARKGRLLLDTLRSPRLKVVMDSANIFHKGELPRMAGILEEAFSLLGPDIALAHAKDLRRDGEAGQEAAGTGLLDYDHYVSLLRAAHYEGPLVLHGLAESQVDQAVAFLRAKLAVAEAI